MIEPNPKLQSRMSLAELWRSTLDRTPTTFGRLAYLADLRDPATGRYSHTALAQVAGPEEVDRALRQSHHRVFSQWLGFGLSEQKADLDEFLGASDRRRALCYRHMIPAGAREVEKQLFVTDLETLFQLFDIERNQSARPPGA